MDSEFSIEGGNYGSVQVQDTHFSMTSAFAKKKIFDLNIENVSLCVVPANNRDDIEIQFAETQSKDKKEDVLVQMTLHFPAGEDDEGITQAESYHAQIMSTGVIKSVTGDIIVEFSREQGNFVTPRGKYALQLTSNYLHMQGAQYAYKIQYSDMDSFFLLPKLDSGRIAFVISLKKPIRQGNQKYFNLVLETHGVENTININLSQEEIDEKFEGQLAPQMTMPMSSLFGKIFKVVTGVKVFVPKQFLSARDAHCVRCSIKANDGLLYPLAKSFIFIHKPTVIIKFDDIESIEFKRYEQVANSATRNFDMLVILKNSAVGAGESKEYIFMSIDRSEYASLFDYLKSKEIPIKNPQAAVTNMSVLDELGDDDDEDEESEDGDYEDKGSVGSGGDDDESSGSDSEQSQKSEEKPKKTSRKAEPSVEKKRKQQTEKEPGAKKKRQKKDKDAPKGAVTAFMAFSNAIRNQVRAENPTMAMKDVSREIGQRWKLLTAEEKVPYEEQYKKDRQRYKEEMDKYNESKKSSVVEIED